MITRNINYTDRLDRLLPTEFVATYLGVTQLVTDNLAWRQPLLLSSLVVCLILIPVMLYKKGVNDIRHYFAVCFSFLAWAYALGDAFQPGAWIEYDLYVPVVGAVLMVLWALVATVLDIKPKDGANNAS